ncbi:MAG: hypothetical protein IT498_02885 [Rubrivivax sp.]|uniref:hypothetical protein n=1 Tax=Ottowia sp. TaxID=1898956 RepID=UPI00217767E0|nr:hypothetical protein [Ottowia sp.]MCC6812970.1 hypothetical protein [Rubrivivax sp.]MCZ2090061.1 hypothetical protein [Burkholderiales bacterium]HNE60408.1 hypothetical protein [Ottowia sp.]HNI83768.1 hypothetical protein [Ottowia sp.]HNJ45448.1 hypothetical protein [Ottowia sp.]
MRHVGLVGRARCVATRDAHGHVGVLLMIETPQRIPHEARSEIQAYFRRKLMEFGELKGRPFHLLLRDRDELSQTQRDPVRSSSSRIAAIVAAANVGVDAVTLAEQVADRREQVRQRLSERRQARQESAYVPLAPVTDVAPLAEV